MARPKRNNADYFSHDSGMRDDPKIKAVRNKFGLTGYAVYNMMLEILTGSSFFKRDIDEIEIEILSADFGIEADLFNEILSYMLKLRLLQKEDNCTFLSQKLTDRLQPVVDKRSNSRNGGKTVTESTQRKGKETKVNKSKVKKTTLNTDTDPIFKPKNISKELPWLDDKLWSEWIDHKKKVKAAVSERSLKANIKKLEEFGTQHSKRIIEKALEKNWKDFYVDDDLESELKIIKVDENKFSNDIGLKKFKASGIDENDDGGLF